LSSHPVPIVIGLTTAKQTGVALRVNCAGAPDNVIK
jgi:hypothetical protein